MDPGEIPENRLYDDLAYLWPVVSPPEEYADEARCWTQVLWESLGPGRHHVLELGVGGGHNLSHLTPDFNGTAVDISRPMLQHSMALNPTVDHMVGDMRCVRLGRTFDAVLVHDAINCITTARDLAAVFTTAAAHLESGGPLLLAPDDFAETTTLPRVESCTHARDGLEVTCLQYTYDPDPTDTAIEVLCAYVICEEGQLRIELDRLPKGLFPRLTWKHLLHAAGFDCTEHNFRLASATKAYTLLLGIRN